MEFNERELRKTGTTTAGIICKDAVVLGAERKSTMGYLVASKKAKKILKVDDHIAMTTAGLVGDAQALERIIKAELKLYKLQEERKAPVKAAAHLIANILYSRRFFPYYVQLLIGGYDNKPRLFSFDASGALQEEDEYFSTGSGSPIALGVFEDKYKKNMSVEEGKKLVYSAIKSATKRDIASGGSGIDIVVIDKNGYHEVSEKEMEKFDK
ncbi:MAG TPA: archaeal proteasome endopeptidase complex subunit beta [Candidatus Desulfofervidus auxilii]|uniref:proteasome endopeptidase complex n=1 Tax=Desulfofervidus auxilii TaxID=1621989 RepID=A0A7V0NEM6_DESA2|nr:archaeal proteasome endopeptidase complex subunit beta [Candidatus Desulfofervidus auxilii]